MKRRQFITASAIAAGALVTGCDHLPGNRDILTKRHSSAVVSGGPEPSPRAAGRSFTISLAEWSYHKALFGKQMTHLDFPAVARREHGIEGIELVNQFFMDRAADQGYLADFNRRCDGEGVSVVLIMCDGEGALGDPEPARRAKAVANHHKWADAAKFLGAHSIRVNAETNDTGSPEEQALRAADGLARLAEYCGRLGLNCIVENHGHLSSNGAWLADVMRRVGRSNCGTLPDFGNFTIREGVTYDRYLGVGEMMPFAKAVSAKSNNFDAAGNCVETDYRRMMKIVLDAGYRGRVGIEYEGETLGEREGIEATRKLLERVRAEGV
jgi:L-ribulose-5-phosphate 3-epimerase